MFVTTDMISITRVNAVVKSSAIILQLRDQGRFLADMIHGATSKADEFLGGVKELLHRVRPGAIILQPAHGPEVALLELSLVPGDPARKVGIGTGPSDLGIGIRTVRVVPSF